MRRLVCGIVAIVVAVPAGADAAKRQRIDSHWRDRQITIDGNNGDWAGPLEPLDDKHPLNATVVNDGQFLYLVLSTSDSAARRQVMREGLIVWFDPAGGDRKHFGIKFPIGVASEMDGRGRGGWGGYGHPRGGADPDPGASTDQPNPVEPPDRLEVYGPVKDAARTFVLDAAPGLAVRVGEVEGYLVYELKVPLEKTSETPYAIEAKTGSLIGLGVETPKVERPERSGGFGGMGGGMGGRGGGMGRPGGGMGGRPGSGFEERKPLKVWATVQLAAH